MKTTSITQPSQKATPAQLAKFAAAGALGAVFTMIFWKMSYPFWAWMIGGAVLGVIDMYLIAPPHRRRQFSAWAYMLTLPWLTIYLTMKAIDEIMKGW